MLVTLPSFSPHERSVLAENAARHDLSNRLAQFASELAECAAAVSRYQTGRKTLAVRQIAEEAAHVLMTMHQIGIVMPGMFEAISEAMHSEMRKMEVRLKFEDREAQSQATPWEKVIADISRHADAIEAVTKRHELPDAVSTRSLPEPDFKPHYTEPVCKPQGFNALFAGGGMDRSLPVGDRV